MFDRENALGSDPIHLQPGQGETLPVRAHAFLNWTKILVLPGEVYRIEPVEHKRWVDWFICSGPERYHSHLTDCQRSKLRNPKAPFFALMVTVDDDDAGSVAVATPQQPYLDRFEPLRQGELTFFANDLEGWYWNNWGSLIVKVTRIQ